MYESLHRHFELLGQNNLKIFSKFFNGISEQYKSQFGCEGRQGTNLH